MNRTSKIILSVFGAIGILVGVFVIGSIVYIYISNRTFEQTLATNLNVSSEWTEIDAVPLLQTRRRVAEVAIALPDYRAERGGPFEIKLSDGRIVRPQVQISDVDGDLLDLRHSGFNYTGDHDLVVLTPKDGFPETTFKTVRIRSDEPFVIARMFWRGRNPT